MRWKFGLLLQTWLRNRCLYQISLRSSSGFAAKRPACSIRLHLGSNGGIPFAAREKGQAASSQARIMNDLPYRRINIVDTPGSGTTALGHALLARRVQLCGCRSRARIDAIAPQYELVASPKDALPSCPVLSPRSNRQRRPAPRTAQVPHD